MNEQQQKSDKRIASTVIGIMQYGNCVVSIDIVCVREKFKNTKSGTSKASGLRAPNITFETYP